MLPTPTLPPEPEHSAAEREMLNAYLDYQRGVVLRKVGGLDGSRLREVMTPTGLTLLGMVKHLANVERYWFRIIFAGERLDVAWSDEDLDADWRVAEDEAPETILALYTAEVDAARAVADDAELDAVAANPEGDGATMRWILLHMIEETARHLGHADLMRERLDGKTGD